MGRLVSAPESATVRRRDSPQPTTEIETTTAVAEKIIQRTSPSCAWSVSTSGASVPGRLGSSGATGLTAFGQRAAQLSGAASSGARVKPLSASETSVSLFWLAATRDRTSTKGMSSP